MTLLLLIILVGLLTLWLLVSGWRSVAGRRFERGLRSFAADEEPPALGIPPIDIRPSRALFAPPPARNVRRLRHRPTGPARRADRTSTETGAVVVPVQWSRSARRDA